MTKPGLIKHLAISALLIVCLCNMVFSQESSHLPYSIFGIGELTPKGFSRNAALGKTGIALPSNLGLNDVNPASLFPIDSISFFLDLGLAGDFVKYSTSSQSQKASNVNFQNIAFGFPVNNWWKSSFGMVPYSMVGYKVAIQRMIEGTTDPYNSIITGNGGISKLYWQNTVTPFRNLHLGVSFGYLFGSIRNNESTSYSLFSSSIITEETNYLNSFNVDFGLMYRLALSGKSEVLLGMTYGPGQSLNFRKEKFITQGSDTILANETTYTGLFHSPMHYGGGITVNLSGQILLTGDYEFSNWSKTKSDNQDYIFANTNAFRGGIEYTPKKQLNAGYFRRMTYRAGGFSEDYYLKINGVATKNTGFTFGFSFPMPGNTSSINLSFTEGRLGTTDKGLILKNYSSVFLGFTLHDWWFIKHKFD